MNLKFKNKIELRNNFLDSLKNDLSKIEGSYNFDIASGVGTGLEQLYELLDYWEKQTFIDTATEDKFIDKHCILFGVERRKASKAVGEITITGEPGFLVKAETIVINRKGIKYKVTSQVYLNGKGTANTTIECLQPGEIGNCAAGEINSFEIATTQLYAVTNQKEIKGGYEKEPNELLIQRAREKALQPAHSGNVNDYMQWAKEVDGVGNVYVIPTWNGGGTVKVLISDYNKEQASEELIKRVKERIENADGRPIGADVTVESFKNLDVTITGSVYLVKGYILEDIKKIMNAEIKVAMQQNKVIYDKDKKHVLSLNKIERLVLDIDGVIDCKLQINGQDKNVEFDLEYAPKLKAVDVHEN